MASTCNSECQFWATERGLWLPACIPKNMGRVLALTTPVMFLMPWKVATPWTLWLYQDAYVAVAAFNMCRARVLGFGPDSSKGAGFNTSERTLLRMYCPLALAHRSFAILHFICFSLQFTVHLSSFGQLRRTKQRKRERDCSVKVLQTVSEKRNKTYWNCQT